MWVKGEIFRDLADPQIEARGGLDRTAQLSIFDRLEWFQRTWAHCPVPGTPLIVRARADGADAWLFLVETAPGRATGLASWYTLAFRPVLTGAPAAKVAHALIVATARRLLRRLARITIDHVPADDAAMVCAAFTAAGWIATSEEQVANWSVDVAGKSFADYWAERPGELRSTARRKAAKSEISVEILDRFDERAWEEYCDVYAASWKPDEGSTGFLREMACSEGEAGTLRLGIARLDGRAIAAQLWTVEHGIAVIHKLAHREEVGDISPGTILSHAMFERVIDGDRVDRIDFGTGDDGYKAAWMDTRVMRMRVVLNNPRRVDGLVGAGRARVGQLVARLRSR